MSRFPARKSQIDFGKILRNLVVIVVIVVCLLSGTLYFNFENATTSIVCAFIKDGLNQIGASADFMTESSKNLLLQLYQGDTTVNQLLYRSNPEDGSYYDVYVIKALMQLRNYCTAGYNIQSIYLYNGGTKRVYSSLYEKGEAAADMRDFFDVGFVEMIGNIGRYRPLTPIPRKIPQSSGRTADVYTYLLYDALGAGGGSYNVIAINIYESRMHAIIQSLNASRSDDVLIVDRGGLAMIASRDAAMLEDVSDRPYIQKVLGSQGGSGYFVGDVDGERSLVTFVSSPSLGWSFIRVTPYSNVTRRLDQIKFTSLLVMLLVLTGGILWSFYISRRLYKPIGGLMDELAALQKEKSSGRSARMRQLLQELLLDDGAGRDVQALRGRLAELGVRLDADGCFVVMILLIDRYRDFCNRFNLSDRNLVKFSIMDKAAELASGRCPCEAADTGGDRIVLLLNVPGESVPRQALQELIGELQREILTGLRVSLSAFVSAGAPGIGSVCALYNATTKILSHRLALGHGCAVFQVDAAAGRDSPPAYSPEKEKLLTDALMLGRIDRAEELLNIMIGMHKRNPHGQFRAALLRITLAVHTALEIIEKNNGLMFHYSLDGMITDQEAIETMDEFKAYFFEIFETVGLKLEDKRGGRHQALIASAEDAVRQRHADKNLSLEMVADRLSISPSYLRRLFKHETGKSLAEYINDFRLEKARGLLLRTDRSISDIADAAGFINSSYFYTLFKKKNGITPNDYRLNRQTEGKRDGDGAE